MKMEEKFDEEGEGKVWAGHGGFEISSSMFKIYMISIFLTFILHKQLKKNTIAIRGLHICVIKKKKCPRNSRVKPGLQ